MALETHQLYSEATRGALPRIQPEQGPGALVVKTFAGIGGSGGTLAVGTPVYFDAASGFCKKTAPAGTPANIPEQVHGIVFPSAVVVDATAEVLGTVMLKGSIHLDDICAALGVATNDANTLLTLRSSTTRYRGIFIDGLTLSK